MGKLNGILEFLVILAMAYCLCAIVDRCTHKPIHGTQTEQAEPMLAQRDTVTFRDTVFIEKPRYVSTMPIGVKYMVLPCWIRPDTVTVRDSVEVAVAIEQRHYQSDDYEAWVSGLAPTLDSLRITRPATVITETRYITKWRQKRWGLSVNAGYGITPNGMQPYVGIGISYMFLSF